MRELRQRRSQTLINQQLNGRVGKMLCGPHDVSDLHCGVIDDRGKIIKCPAIGTQNHWIAQQIGLPLDLPANQVLQNHSVPQAP